jgi:hypothetical protein
VALFDADGRFIARTAPEQYRFTNGLWWVGDALWTTDTNRTQLKRLDGRTLALQQTLTLDATRSARYLGPARAHPAAAERVAMIRFHNGMTQGRVTVLDGGTERSLPQGTVIEPVDVDWFGDDAIVTDGASHQVLRVDAATGLARPFADARARLRLDQGLQQRARLWLSWKLGLVAAAGLFMVALMLAWRAQQMQQQADDEARPIDLSYLGTPRLTRLQRMGPTHRLLLPWLLFFVPLLVVQVFNVRGWLGLDRAAWVWVLAGATPLLVVLIVWLQRRQSRLALDPAFEPVLNAQAVARLERGQGLREALRPDETVLETAMWMCPTLRWVVLTDLRLLCFVAGLGRPRLEWAHPRAALRDVAWLPRSPQRWSRWVGAGAGGPGWLQLRLPDGRLVQGRVTAPTVGQRLVAELTDARERPRSAALPVVPAPRDGSGPGPWRAAVLSLLLPGLGQWLQRRAGAALLLFLPWAVLVTFVAVPTLVTAWTPRADVPGWRVSDRHALAHAVGFHVGAAAALHDLAALHHQVLVGQFGGKVVVLLHQHDGHGLAVGQHADDAADVLDDAGLDAFGGLVQHQQLGAGGQRAGDGQLLLLPARQVAATAVQDLLEHGEQLEQLGRDGVPPGLLARPMRRFSSTVRRPKISRPCGT